MTLVTIDIGGTSIKYAKYEQGKLSELSSQPTPDNLETFYSLLSQIVKHYQENADIEGVAISSPGAVNVKTGVIEGASALPYIHDFDIHHELEKLFALPVSIENDANCAALAEVKFGAAKGLKNILFLVLGTGVGGAVVFDGKIHHGKHLFGGEFGYIMLDDEHTLSSFGSAVHMAERYNEKTGANLTGQEVFDLAFSGDEIAKEEADFFLWNVAKSIFNLTYSFDPELVVIGGGVSKADWLVPKLQEKLEEIMKIVEIAPFMPEIVTCQYHNDANLLGAVVNFEESQKG